MSIQINENISLHYIPMEKLKTSSIGIYIHRPLNGDQAALCGLLPFVMKRGFAKCPTAKDLSHKLDNLYGADLRAGVLKKGLDQVISFTLESISERYTPFSEPLFSELTELAMSLMFEPVTENGAFLPSYVEQEKKNAVERIESIKNDKRSYAALRCSQEMFAGTELGVSRYGTAEEVMKITPDMLFDYYRRIITSSPIDIYLSGECDTSAVEAVIKKVVAGRIFSPSLIATVLPFTVKREVNKLEEQMDVAQGKLSMGFTTGTGASDDEYWPLMVANSIFGSGAHSKLFNNVREKLSLCYYASSSLDRYTGVLGVNAGIEFENFQKAYDEILLQLKELQDGNVSELEFMSSTNAIINSLKSCRDDQFAMQSFKLSEKISGNNRSLDYVIDKISSVTKEQAIEASKKIKLDTVYFLKG